MSVKLLVVLSPTIILMTFIYTDKEMKKIRSIQKSIDGIITIQDACNAFGCSERTIYRYKKIFLIKGWFKKIILIQNRKSFRTHLIKMKLKGIKNYEETNKFFIKESISSHIKIEYMNFNLSNLYQDNTDNYIFENLLTILLCYNT